MPVSIGTYNYGTGFTYATLRAAIADIAAVLTGPLNFVQKGPSNDSGLSILAPSIDFGAFDITIQTDTPNFGNPNIGWVSQFDQFAFLGAYANAGGRFVVSGAYLESVVSSGAALSAVGTGNLRFSLCHALIKGNSAITGTLIHSMANGSVDVSNSKIWSQGDAFFIAGASGAVIRMENSICYTVGATKTAIKCANFGIGSYIRNSIGFVSNPVTASPFSVGALVQQATAASAGATASGSTITNLAQAGNIISLVEANAGFLNTDPSSSLLWRAGQAPALPCNMFVSPYPIGFSPLQPQGDSSMMMPICAGGL